MAGAIVSEHWSTWITQSVSTLARINSYGYHLLQKQTQQHIRSNKLTSVSGKICSLFQPLWLLATSISLLPPDRLLHFPHFLHFHFPFHHSLSLIFHTLHLSLFLHFFVRFLSSFTSLTLSILDSPFTTIISRNVSLWGDRVLLCPAGNHLHL